MNGSFGGGLIRNLGIGAEPAPRVTAYATALD